VAFFGDGSFLASPGTFSLRGNPPAGRAERTLEPLYHISPDGSTTTQVGSFKGLERVIVPTGPEGALERRQRPFGRGTVIAAAADRFYVADNTAYEIRVYSMRGELIQVIRKQTILLPIEAWEIQAFQDSVLATVGAAARPQMRVLFASMPPPPETHPAFQLRIHVDGDLNLWVKESNRFGDHRSHWSVFSAEGEFRGTLEMPPGVEVLEIGSDYLLGLRRDELDVEYVELFGFRE
jgi:hypothetical protein